MRASRICLGIWIGMLSGAGLSCSTDTEVVLSLDAEAALRMNGHRIVVHAEGTVSNTVEIDVDAAGWPYRGQLTPASSLEPVTVVAELYDEEEMLLATQRAVLRFRESASRTLSLLFTDDCRSCSTLENCVGGECVGACIGEVPEGEPSWSECRPVVCERNVEPLLEYELTRSLEAGGTLPSRADWNLALFSEGDDPVRRDADGLYLPGANNNFAQSDYVNVSDELTLMDAMDAEPGFAVEVWLSSSGWPAELGQSRAIVSVPATLGAQLLVGVGRAPPLEDEEEDVVRTHLLVGARGCGDREARPYYTQRTPLPSSEMLHIVYQNDGTSDQVYLNGELQELELHPITGWQCNGAGMETITAANSQPRVPGPWEIFLEEQGRSILVGSDLPGTAWEGRVQYAAFFGSPLSLEEILARSCAEP